MRLSYSAISTYQKCPLSYKFMYVDKRPTKPSHHLSFGSSVHSALEFLYHTDSKEPASLERLLEELDNAWLREGYESDAQELEYKQKGRDILTRFYNANIAAFAPAIAVEERFSLDVDGIQVNGIIDRIDRTTGGGLEIIDYKTNAKLPPRSKIASDLQLPIYHMAAEQIFGESPEKVSLYFLVPGQKISAAKTKGDIKRTRNTIITVATCIQNDRQSGEFKPTPNPLCPWCDFIQECGIHDNNPVIMQKARVNGKLGLTASNENIDNGKSGDNEDSGQLQIGQIETMQQQASEIEKAVDEYFELVGSIKKDRERLQRLQQNIHEYCEQNGIAQVRGTKGALSRRAQRVTHYNIDKLRELLEPRGLWEEVIDVNGNLLKQLLDEKADQTELSHLIEATKELEEISYYLYIKDELNDEQ